MVKSEAVLSSFVKVIEMGTNQWLIFFLNFEKLFSALICFGNEFQLCGPSVLKLLRPYFTVLGAFACNCVVCE